MRDDRLPIMRIFTALFFIETDDIATVLYPDFLDFERCWILGFAALWNTFKPACTAAEHRDTNFRLLAHPHSNDIADRRIAVFKRLQGCLAHHPTIGYDSYFTDPEAFPHAFDYRQKGGDIGVFARPHLTANGATLHIHCHAKDHLLEIRAMILIMTALADRLSTAALKVKRSGVEKDQFHFGEQIPP